MNTKLRTNFLWARSMKGRATRGGSAKYVPRCRYLERTCGKRTNKGKLVNVETNYQYRITPQAGTVIYGGIGQNCRFHASGGGIELW